MDQGRADQFLYCGHRRCDSEIQDKLSASLNQSKILIAWSFAFRICWMGITGANGFNGQLPRKVFPCN